jgi:hypothetical protein
MSEHQQETTMDDVHDLLAGHGIEAGKVNFLTQKIFKIISETWLKGYNEGMHDEAMAQDAMKERRK